MSDYLRKTKLFWQLCFSRVFLSVALSVFLAIYSILEPETAPSTKLQHFGIRIETLGSQENLICLCSSSFLQGNPLLGGTQMYTEKHNLGALCDSDIYGPLVAEPTKHRVNKKALSRMFGSLKFGTYTQTDRWEHKWDTRDPIPTIFPQKLLILRDLMWTFRTDHLNVRSNKCRIIGNSHGFKAHKNLECKSKLQLSIL